MSLVGSVANDAIVRCVPPIDAQQLNLHNDGVGYWPNGHLRQPIFSALTHVCWSLSIDCSAALSRNFINQILLLTVINCMEVGWSYWWTWGHIPLLLNWDDNIYFVPFPNSGYEDISFLQICETCSIWTFYVYKYMQILVLSILLKK